MGSRLQVLISDVILRHPANEASTSWKFLIVAGESLTALEGFYHRPPEKAVTTRARLKSIILDEVANDVIECEEAIDLFPEEATVGDFIPLALRRFNAKPEQATQVAERLMGRWAWARELMEKEKFELVHGDNF